MEVSICSLSVFHTSCFFFFQTIQLKSQINLSGSLESAFYNSLLKNGKNNNAPLGAFPTSYYHSCKTQEKKA